MGGRAFFEDNLDKILGNSEQEKLVRKFREDRLINELNVDELRDKFSIIKDQINKFTSLKDYSLTEIAYKMLGSFQKK